jgi:glyoxylase-like metal-dependent hydrolase (beta-lactamase superfamily II)
MSPVRPVFELGASRSAALLLLLSLGACTPSGPPDEPEAPAAAETPTTAALATRLIETLGGRAALESVETLVLRGAGARTRMGQIAFTGGEDGVGQLNGVTETLDLANGRAAFDYDVVNGDFTQHRTEVFTTFEGARIGWNTGPDRPKVATSPNGIFSWATQNSPEMLLRRNIISVALGAAATASGEAAEPRPFDGRASLYGVARLPSGEELGLFFDPSTGLLNGFTALDTETMLGDVEAQYSFGDYRSVNGLTLPHSVTITKQDRPYSSIEYTSIAINDPAATEIFTVPAEALEQARQVAAAPGPWAPLTWNRIAPNLYHAVGYSHHSMVVEFPSFVAVIEGPYSEAQSATLARLVQQEIGKPIRYVVPSHPHYDHTGGLRGLVAVGATAVLARGHEGELRAVIEAPHTNPPDELARRRAAGETVGSIEVFDGTRVIEDGGQRLELYEVTTIPHVRPKTLAYVPSARAVFQSDLFFGAPSPDATALHGAIRERNLQVDMIVGGHGGVLPFATLVTAAAGGAQ